MPAPTTSYLRAEQGSPLNLTESTTDPGNTVLMHWGLISFAVYPMNIDAYDHMTEADWAQKEIAGAEIFREWVGENDEILHLRGHLFPYRIGGMTQIEHFDAKRRSGMPDSLMRGGTTGGSYMGWWICHRLSRAHTYLSAEGIGQMIAFEAEMIRIPIPTDAALYTSGMFQSVGGP
jgi:uncharacterized protein